VFVANFLILMQLGAKHVESPFIEFGQISTGLYFLYFTVVMYGVTLIENTFVDLRSLDKKDSPVSQKLITEFPGGVLLCGIETLLHIVELLHMDVPSGAELYDLVREKADPNSSMTEEIEKYVQTKVDQVTKATNDVLTSTDTAGDTQEHVDECRSHAELERDETINELKEAEQIAKDYYEDDKSESDKDD
jgi:hypothetical protein